MEQHKSPLAMRGVLGGAGGVAAGIGMVLAALGFGLTPDEQALLQEGETLTRQVVEGVLGLVAIGSGIFAIIGRLFATARSRFARDPDEGQGPGSSGGSAALLALVGLAGAPIAVPRSGRLLGCVALALLSAALLPACSTIRDLATVEFDQATVLDLACKHGGDAVRERDGVTCPSPPAENREVTEPECVGLSLAADALVDDEGTAIAALDEAVTLRRQSTNLKNSAALCQQLFELRALGRESPEAMQAARRELDGIWADAAELAIEVTR